MFLRKSKSPKRPERGAALVETAIILPLLLMLAFGAVEYGFAFSQASALKNAVRAGTREAVASTYTVTPDYRTLQAFKNSLGRIDPNDVRTIVIYKASTTDGKIPDACKTASVAGVCNFYTSADLNASQATIENKQTAWAPSSRVGGDDYLGIWVQSNRRTITKIFGSTINVGDQSVMLIDPVQPTAVEQTVKTNQNFGPPGQYDGNSGSGGGGRG